MGFIKNSLVSFLRSEYICFLVFKIRFLYLVYVKRNIRVFENDQSVLANDYSIKMLKKGKTSNRPLKLIRPLSVIEVANKDGEVLSIGSRFETELLYLVAYGFKPSKVHGFDMISYSNWIDLGNMHNLPYSDNKFDTTIVGWVLPYSDRPELAVQEILRVTKSGGIIGVGLTAYTKKKIQEALKSGQYAVRPDSRKQTTTEVLELFKPCVAQVYLRHDPPSDREGSCLLIFSIKK